MITGKVSSFPKNAYLRCVGKGFSSSLGGLSSEGNALSSFGGNGSNLGVHPLTSNTSLCSIIEYRNSDSSVVTSSSQLGLTKHDLRGSSCETLSRYFFYHGINHVNFTHIFFIPHSLDYIENIQINSHVTK